MPTGCNIAAYKGEFIAPFDGTFKLIREHIYDLVLPKGIYPTGTEDALRFVGIFEPNLSNVNSITLNFGHVDDNGGLGNVVKGQSLGDIVPVMDHHKLAYQVILVYKGVSYLMSPTLFLQEKGPWPCVSGSPYDCVAEPSDYIK